MQQIVDHLSSPTIALRSHFFNIHTYKSDGRIKNGQMSLEYEAVGVLVSKLREY
jgi:hypothetical protein